MTKVLYTGTYFFGMDDSQVVSGCLRNLVFNFPTKKDSFNNFGM